jgi:hypothetical protein
LDSRPKIVTLVCASKGEKGIQEKVNLFVFNQNYYKISTDLIVYLYLLKAKNVKNPLKDLCL